MIWLKLQGKKSGGKKCRKRSRTEEVSENTKTCRFPDSSPYITGAEHTLQIMRQAPVVIFVVNEIAASFDKILTMDERVSEICNAQSEYSRAMKSHFRKFGNQMSGSGNHLCNYASLLA